MPLWPSLNSGLSKANRSHASRRVMLWVRVARISRALASKRVKSARPPRSGLVVLTRSSQRSKSERRTAASTIGPSSKTGERGAAMKPCWPTVAFDCRPKLADSIRRPTRQVPRFIGRIGKARAWLALPPRFGSKVIAASNLQASGQGPLQRRSRFGQTARPSPLPVGAIVVRPVRLRPAPLRSSDRAAGGHQLDHRSAQSAQSSREA
jgi:hypothetical protein